MRVTCKLCQFEKNGACTKKRQSGKPKKVKLNKRRTCDVYKEDGLKVFNDFRKREQYRARLKQVELRRAKLAAAVRGIREQALISATTVAPKPAELTEASTEASTEPAEVLNDSE